MNGWWAAAAVGAGIFGWAMYLDFRHQSEKRLAAWWVSRASEWGGATGPCSLIISVAALLGYGVLAFIGYVLATRLGDPRWALLFAGPAMLAYAPFMFATGPVGRSGYGAWRSDLEAAGADARVQRRIAWWAGPPSLVGLFLMMAMLVETFVA